MAQTNKTMITIEHDESSADINNMLMAQSGDRVGEGFKLRNAIKYFTSGFKRAKFTIGTVAVPATGTITLSSHVATNTVTVNGITFTCVASGATGNQYNVEADDTATAVALAAALNANTTLDGMIVATSALGVVTLTALYPGELGNAITLAISANGSVSAARMASGTNGTTERSFYFGSGS